MVLRKVNGVRKFLEDDGGDYSRDVAYDPDNDCDDEEDNPTIIGGAEEVKDRPEYDECMEWFNDPDRELKLRGESEWL